MALNLALNFATSCHGSDDVVRKIGPIGQTRCYKLPRERRRRPEDRPDWPNKVLQACNCSKPSAEPHGAIMGSRYSPRSYNGPARGKLVLAPWAITEARYTSVGPSGRHRTITSFVLWQRRCNIAPAQCHLSGTLCPLRTPPFGGSPTATLWRLLQRVFDENLLVLSRSASRQCFFVLPTR